MPELKKWLKALQTKEREQLNQDALDALTAITTRGMNVEPPAGTVTTTGNWNSQNKVVGRMHPVPRPGTQTQGGAGYANPDGPTDQGEDSQ